MSSVDAALSGAKPLDQHTQYWMVGAYWSEADPSDQTARFLREGVWENGYEDKLLDEVRSILPGDRIAIKAVTTRKSDLPFDAHDRTVSCLLLKATGTVKHNPGDGRQISVSWDPPPQEPRIWYFYTYRGTIWHLRPDVDYAQRLIAFAFEGAAQDYDWFLDRGFAPPNNTKSLNAVIPAGLEQSFPDDEGQNSYSSVMQPYSVDDVLADGAFMSRNEVQNIIDRWSSKKNLVLQGSPGVGKTFLARRLAYALMQERAPARVGFVQFHQSYAYDDFVRGYRPQIGGGFSLQDGVFHRFCAAAAADSDPARPWVFIIDEINRGNLAQIFGELMMLIEADKREAEFAVPLVYRKDETERFFVPPNVYVIGLMNIADRSLALVDYALRRRFAFITLKPQYECAAFKSWLSERHMDQGLISLVIERLVALNERISEDKLLVPLFKSVTVSSVRKVRTLRTSTVPGTSRS